MKIILSRCLKFLSLPFITLAFFNSYVWANEREIPFRYELAWQKTAQAIALKGIILSTSNKDLGVLQGTSTFDEKSDNFVCPILEGRAKEYTYSLSATVREKTKSSSVVSIHIKAVRKSYQNKKFIFTIGRVHSENECINTGKLEDSIFQKILEP